MASAVPHEPAPRTATGSCAMSLPAKWVTMTQEARLRLPSFASVRRALRACLRGLLLQSPREQLVEILGRQHEVRKAALRHELRHGDARIRKQHVRADGADGA